MLGELDDVSVKVLVTCASTPRFVSGLVEDSGTTVDRHCMSISDVVDGQADLNASSGPSIGRVKGEMKIGASSPGDLRVDTPDPTIFDCVVARMEIESESISIQRHRPLQVGNLQDDRHQPPFSSHRHLASRKRARL
jgi:hypothetical protein